MKIRGVSFLLSVALIVSACSTTQQQSAGGEARPSTDCVLIAEIAKAQYGFDETMILPVSRDGYVPRCDWAALGLQVEIIDPDEPKQDVRESLEPLVTFTRPRRSGGLRLVTVYYWMGVHTYERQCRLRVENGEWRLVEACPITWRSG